MSDEKKITAALDIGDKAADGIASAAKETSATVGKGLEAAAKATEGIAKEARGAAADLAGGLTGGLNAVAGAVTGVADKLATVASKPSVLAAASLNWLAYVYVGVVLAAVLAWPLKDLAVTGLATWERQQKEIRMERFLELEAAAKRDARITAEREAAAAKHREAAERLAIERAEKEKAAADALKDGAVKKMKSLEDDNAKLRREIEYDMRPAFRDGLSTGNLAKIFPGKSRVPCWFDYARAAPPDAREGWYFIAPDDCRSHYGRVATTAAWSATPSEQEMAKDRIWCRTNENWHFAACLQRLEANRRDRAIADGRPPQ